MGYIITALVALILFVFVTKVMELNRAQKIGVAVGIASVAFVITLYILMDDAKTDRLRETILAFEQNQTIVCEGDIEANATSFNYSIGAHSLLGKPNTPHAGKIISLYRCQPKP
ncbi:MAG: hypothetical protein KU37_09300 [Sulfuricurvum sp. PC08-66]|nr:MAG: hypothetical protein KU37_09300 [Sulfuricurvum sp. PC08-66]